MLSMLFSSPMLRQAGRVLTAGRRSWTCGGSGGGATPQLQAPGHRDASSWRHGPWRVSLETFRDFNPWFLVMFWCKKKPWQVNSQRPGWSFFQWLIDSVTWKHQDESDCVARDPISKSGAWFCVQPGPGQMWILWCRLNQTHLPSRFQINPDKKGRKHYKWCRTVQCYIYIFCIWCIMMHYYYLCIYMFIVWWKGVVGIWFRRCEIPSGFMWVISIDSNQVIQSVEERRCQARQLEESWLFWDHLGLSVGSSTAIWFRHDMTPLKMSCKH